MPLAADHCHTDIVLGYEAEGFLSVRSDGDPVTRGLERLHTPVSHMCVTDRDQDIFIIS